MTTVTLSELLTARDESLRIRPARGRLLAARIRRWGRESAFPAAARILAALVSLLYQHGIVLSGCTAFVIAAGTISATLAWFVAGAALFFLEARRR